MNHLLTWLGRGPTPFKIAVIAFTLGLPALGAGFMLDDYAHLAAFSDLPRLNEIFKSPWHMFAFVSGDAVQMRSAIEQGLYPWWTSDRIVLNFWRPVTVISHGIDHVLWRNSPFFAHLQSLLWYAALAGLVALLYRQIASAAESGEQGRGQAASGVAALAALLYAIDDGHALPMAWVANRNATLAAFFGVACLLLHLKWRREGKAWALGAALLALTASVHANEGGIATTAYLFAFAVFLDRGPGGRRALTLLPYAAVVVAWRAYYSWLGFGARNSHLYIDPVGEPLRFAGALVERYPALLMGQWANFPSEVFFLLEGAGFWGLWTGCLLTLIALGAALWIPAMRTREAAFWAMGMALAAVPVCATFPSNRLLLFIGLGGMGLLAQFIVAVRNDPADGRRVRRGVCTVLIAVHLVLAPLAALGTIAGLGVISSRIRASADTVAFPDGVESKTVVIANSPSYFLTAYMTIARSLRGDPTPARLYSLSPNNPAPVPTTMERIDARTLRVRPEGGFPWMLFRSKTDPFTPGDEVDLEAMTVRVLEVNDIGEPQSVDFVFDAPLEDEAYVWMEIEGLDYVPFELPKVGETRPLNEPEANGA